MKKCKKGIIIFDMDGTLYNFSEGSFRKSRLRKKVLQNAKKYIKNKLNKNNIEAELILKDIIGKYKEDISIGLENKFSLDRFEYFNTVWSIPSRKFITKSFDLKPLLKSLEQTYLLILVSDAPLIWVKDVLSELKIYDIFNNRIFSGEKDMRKNNKKYFQLIIKKFKCYPEKCFVIGDQEKTDIIPAKKIGCKTIFVNEKKKSKIADFSIKNILELPKIIK